MPATPPASASTPPSSTLTSNTPTSNTKFYSLVTAFLAVLVVGLFILPTPDATSDEQPQDAASTIDGGFIINNVRVFDGEKTWPQASVWVTGTTIKAIDKNLEAPEGVAVIDGSGHTLLPGLIDSHTHSWGTARSDSLRFGVTTLLDQFTATSMLAAGIEDRKNGGATDQADLFSAGTLATAAGGHGTQYGLPVPTLAKASDAAAWVVARKAENSDWIKIVIEHAGSRNIPTLDMDTVAAVIQAAHEHELLAVVHVSTIADGLAAIERGADGLVHVWRDRLPTTDEVAMIKESGAFVIPTLVVQEGMVDPAPSMALADGPLARGLSKSQRAGLEGRFPAGLTIDWTMPTGSVQRLHDAGVPILAGSDAPNPATAMGLSMHRELRLLVDAGLSPEQALAAATAQPADHFGIPQRGRIKAGALADLLLVEGDPTVDINDSTRIARIWKAGHEVSAAVPVEIETEKAAQAPEQTLISNFDDGLTNNFGAGWASTTDQRIGGASTGDIEAQDGVLVVSGTIAGGAMFPWSGAIAFLGEQPMTPVDMSSRTRLTFRIRGDARTYIVMLFSGPAEGLPAQQRVEVTDQWQTVELDLNDFPGARLDTLRAFAVTASQPTGDFRFEMDDVKIE